MPAEFLGVNRKLRSYRIENNVDVEEMIFVLLKLHPAMIITFSSNMKPK
jgi:hypothetical protein